MQIEIFITDNKNHNTKNYSATLGESGGAQSYAIMKSRKFIHLFLSQCLLESFLPTLRHEFGKN
jgi:hypothetical protein